MRPIVTDRRIVVRVTVVLSLRVEHIGEPPAKTAEQIEVPLACGLGWAR